MILTPYRARSRRCREVPYARAHVHFAQFSFRCDLRLRSEAPRQADPSSSPKGGVILYGDFDNVVGARARSGADGLVRIPRSVKD